MKLHLFIDKNNIITGYQTYPLFNNAIELTDKEFKTLEDNLNNNVEMKVDRQDIIEKSIRTN